MSDNVRNTTILATAVAMLTAIIGLAGYLPGLRILASAGRGFLPMAPSTALSFLLQGAGLLWLSFKPSKKRPIVLILAFAVFLTSAFGLLVLVENLTGPELSVQDKLFPVQERIGGIPVGHMSPLTGALFVLTGAGVMLLLWRSYAQEDRPAHTAGILGGLALLVSFTAFLGYALGTPLLYRQGATVPIALTTAFAFLWLSLAVMAAAGPNSFPLGSVTGQSTRARLLRAFLPIATIAVMVESLAAVYIPDIIPIGRVYIVVIIVVSSMIITGIIVAWVSAGIARTFDETNAALRVSEERFSKTFQYDPDAIVIASFENLKVVDVNEGFVRLTGISKAQALGKSTDELGIWPDRTARETMLRSLREKGRLDEAEAKIKGGAGDERVALVSAETIEMAGTAHVILVARDITERKEAEAALQQKDRDVREAYAEFFSAVTDKKLLILTPEEITRALVEPLSAPYRISSFEQVGDSRTFLRETLSGLNVGAETLKELITAAGEAVVNGVKHAGSCEVQVYSSDKTVQIRTTDHGAGINFRHLPQAALLPGFSTKKSLGMGFTIMLELCDRVLLSTNQQGTTVLLESRSAA